MSFRVFVSHPTHNQQQQHAVKFKWLTKKGKIIIIRNWTEKPVYWGKFVGQKVFRSLFLSFPLGKNSFSQYLMKFLNLLSCTQGHKNIKCFRHVQRISNSAHSIKMDRLTSDPQTIPHCFDSIPNNFVSPHFHYAYFRWYRCGLGNRRKMTNWNSYQIRWNSFMESLNHLMLVISMVFVVWRSNKSVDFVKYGHKITVHGWLKFEFRN